ncbi:MAG: uracil phosphoribosyltransferase [Bacteroidota bacterium]
MIHVISQQNSIFNRFIAEIRDEKIQKDRWRFRNNLERIGEVFAYEISKQLSYEEQEVRTPLGTAQTQLNTDDPVLCTILRAGLPLHQGLHNYFDQADCAFVSAYRNHKNNTDDFEIEVEYLSSPTLEGRILIISDTMLATGASVLTVFKALKKLGIPKQVHIVSAIGTLEGVNMLRKQLPANVHYWFGALDEELTAQSFIVPGLGDAGDLSYGEKQ